MKTKLILAFLFIASLFLSSCETPGVITYRKIDGKWEPVEVQIYLDDVTSQDIQKVKDKLNEK